ncbi:MAG TPA: hypothetical protein VK324_14760, partial [Tepidisphaeraceae bacterium]|nr:hypothetical protein [Tepidisphaeraceae bacterium]
LAVDVPKGVHRVSLYLMNNDPHEGENRHRDHVVELKRRADAPPAPADRPLPQRADEDSAERERRAAARLAEKRAAERLPAIARTRATDFHGPFYAQFALTEGRYWLIVRRDGGYCTKAMGVFFDRLGGPADPHIADVPPPMLHHVDIRPAPPAEADLTAVGRPRAVWAALDAAWERAAADPAAVASLARIEMPYRVLAYRAAAATLGERADESLARWRYKLPLWTSPDRSKLIVDVTAAWERNLDDNPSLVASDFKAAMEEVNKAYHGRARKGGGDPAPVFDPTSVPVTAAMPSLKAGVAGYLAWKVNDAIGSFSGSPTTPDPAAFRNAFGGGSKEPVEQYKHVAHLLQAADGFANRTADDKRRVGLAAALAAGHASADGLRDPWLTRRIVDAFVVPLLPLAEDDPASPVSKQAVARQVLSLYAAADADEQATAVLEEKARAAGLPVD